MIRNILTRIFSGESSPASENKPASQATAPPAQSVGISSVRDSFETTAAKGSAQFELGVMPSPQNSTGAEKQGELLKQKEDVSQKQKKLEEFIHDKQNENNQDPFSDLGKFLVGDDRGTAIQEKMQTYLSGLNDAEKRSEHMAEVLDDTTDDIKKHWG
jgi:hypothetical protein